MGQEDEHSRRKEIFEIYKSNINPGYSLVGRFRGLSEIRGIISTIRL